MQLTPNPASLAPFGATVAHAPQAAQSEFATGGPEGLHRHNVMLVGPPLPSAVVEEGHMVDLVGIFLPASTRQSHSLVWYHPDLSSQSSAPPQAAGGSPALLKITATGVIHKINADPFRGGCIFEMEHIAEVPNVRPSPLLITIAP